MSRSRVLSLRLSEREYEVLSALSVLEDEPVSSVIRRSIGEHARSVSSSPDFIDMTRAAEERARAARASLLSDLDIEDTGEIRL
jgi:hypothetical protein